MTDSGEALLLQTLGAEFLAYVTATAPDSIRLRLTQSSDRLTDEREAVLTDLLTFIKEAASNPDQARHLNRRLGDVFGRVPEEESDSVANLLRKHSGGDIWQPSNNEGTVAYKLLILLRDMYPIMLLPEDTSSPFSNAVSLLGGSMHRHPQHDSFFEAVLADEFLKQLFPTVRDDQGPVGVAYSSAGSGGSTQLWLFAEQLIGAGWSWARLSTRMPTIEEHAAGVKSSLDTLVNAIKKTPVTVPVRVGITGVLLPADCNEIELGWARLRRADERDQNTLIDSALAGSAYMNEPDGSTVQIQYRGDIVLEMNLEYRLRLKEIDIRKNGWPRDLDPSVTIEKRLENLRLGLLLALPERQQPTLVVSTWRLIIDPNKIGIIAGWNDPRNVPNLTPQQLTDQDVAKWKEWAILVGEKRQKSVDVAIRRALLAASQRPMPEDKLLDAVVVWENLFGSRQETTMRVAASLAWLLADGATERKEIQSKVAKLYALRSAIVHGSRELTPEEAQTKPNEALMLALDALRKVFRERSDLLEEADSSARSNRLLLGD